MLIKCSGKYVKIYFNMKITFLCWRDISRDLFLEETLKFFFSYKHEKKKKNQARNEIFRQMTMTLTLFQNVIYVQWTRKG